MSIFGVIETEKIIQVADKLRINAAKSFVGKGSADITLVEVNPEIGVGSYIDVTGSSYRDWFLDWAYSGTSRVVSVGLRITTDGSPVETFKDVQVFTAEDDYLFSGDGDLKNKEHDILKYVPEGRSSFLNVHRQARDLILNYLDEIGITDNEGNRLTKTALVDLEEVREWSAALTLHLIYQNLSNQVDDIFDRKSRDYKSKYAMHRNRLFLRYDKNGDGNLDKNEGEQFNVVHFSRR